MSDKRPESSLWQMSRGVPLSSLAHQYPGEFMLAIAVCLISSATGWAEWGFQSAVFWGRPKPGLIEWFQHNGIPLMGLCFVANTIGGILLIFSGVSRLTARAKGRRHVLPRTDLS